MSSVTSDWWSRAASRRARVLYQRERVKSLHFGQWRLNSEPDPPDTSEDPSRYSILNPMRFIAFLALVIVAASPSVAQNIAPTTFYGQYVPTGPVTALPTTNDAAAQRDLFLDGLDPQSISFFDFEGETVTYTATTGRPSRAPNSPLTEMATARFDGYGALVEIPADLFARNAEIVNPSNRTAPNIDGTWATSGDKYLYAVGYDGRNASVDASIPNGSTEIALSIRYDAAAVTPGRLARPFSAFGGYIIDTEAYDTIRLTLTPFGGGTPVVLDYGEVNNQNNQTDDPRGDFPGNYQVSFVGFSDPDTQYERIDISFVGADLSPVDNEAFGFDDFVVGEINQVEGPDQTPTAGPVTLEPGWRLLSAPVRGVTVHDLAQLNLVQGVPAGDGQTQQQYPDAGSNFYWGYQGGTRHDYVPVPSTGSILRPGRGFWWYWYDREFTPNPAGSGGGTSSSVFVDDLTLTATGPEILGSFSEVFQDNTDCSSDPGEACPGGRVRNQPPPLTTQTPNGEVTRRTLHTPEDDDFYMVGNPFPYAMDFSGLAVSQGGTMATLGYIWNPGNPSGLNPRTGDDPEFDGPGTYEIVFETPPASDPDDPTPQGAIAVWNGMLIEVTKTAGEVGLPVLFTYDPATSATVETPPFHGKDTREAYIRFGLFGETESGARTRDEAAYIRFLPSATLGWDADDSTKPTWPGGAKALIAPMSTRKGQPYPLGAMALPFKDQDTSVPLSILTTEPGEYELVWRSAGLHGVLRDLETGAIVDLAEETYTFTAASTFDEWSPRFVMDTFSSSVTTSTDAPGLAESYVGAPSPNPTTGAFHVDVRLGAAAEATVSVYDALGRLMSKTEVSANRALAGQNVRIPTDGFTPGTYLVVVEAPGVRETRRVTVVR